MDICGGENMEFRFSILSTTETPVIVVRPGIVRVAR